jgi:glycosyltransferase involved in cell wall biosynthesis
MAARPRATVVVPTRDRPEALDRCLAALDAQTVDQLDQFDQFDQFDVVVVDDGSRDPGAIRAVVARSPRARLVVGDGRGPAAARNRGAAAATGPVVAFTDDDCRPDPGWLAALCARLDAGATVVAGATIPGNERVSVRASQLVTNHLVEESGDGRGAVGFAPTCNIACRREVWDAVPFDESFRSAAGEDRAWCDHLRATGRRIDLVPEARVRHEPALTGAGFWRQQLRYGAGAYWYLRTVPTGMRPQSAGFYARLLRRAFADGVATGVLVAGAQVATAVGVAGQAYRARAGR